MDATHVLSHLMLVSGEDICDQAGIQPKEERIPQSCILSESGSGQERNGDLLGGGIVESSGHT